MRGLALLFRRELALAWNGGGGPLLALGFYAAIVGLMPFAGPPPERLAAVASAIVWVTLALATLLSIERMFERDFEDGALDLLLMGRTPAAGMTAVKCLAHWVAIGVPLALAAPAAAISLGAPPALAPMILATGLAGGLAFAFVGGLGAALAIGSRRGGVIIAVIVLPLLTPAVLFGGDALYAVSVGAPWRSGLLLLIAYALAAAALCPIAAAAACRNAVS